VVVPVSLPMVSVTVGGLFVLLRLALAVAWKVYALLPVGNRCVDGQAADPPKERVGRRGGLREGTGGMVIVKVPILSVTAWVAG
jgi:hypothetical protein